MSPIRLTLAWLVLVISGCTTLALAPAQDLSDTIGASELTVVQRFGVPTRSYVVGDRKFLSYLRSRIDVEPGVGPWPIYAGGSGWVAIEPYIQQFNCDTTFELASDKVIGFTLRGNACERPFGPGASAPVVAGAPAAAPPAATPTTSAPAAAPSPQAH